MQVPAAFHLPEVCRQIYFEAALTSYRQNMFALNSGHLSTKNSITRLMAAQRRAIRSVLFTPGLLYEHLDKHFLTWYKSMTHTLPNLKNICVPRSTLLDTKLIFYDYRSTLASNYEKVDQALILKRLKSVYGDEINIQFE